MNKSDKKQKEQPNIFDTLHSKGATAAFRQLIDELAEEEGFTKRKEQYKVKFIYGDKKKFDKIHKKMNKRDKQIRRTCPYSIFLKDKSISKRYDKEISEEKKNGGVCKTCKHTECENENHKKTEPYSLQNFKGDIWANYKETGKDKTFVKKANEKNKAQWRNLSKRPTDEEIIEWGISDYDEEYVRKKYYKNKQKKNIDSDNDSNPDIIEKLMPKVPEEPKSDTEDESDESDKEPMSDSSSDESSDDDDLEY